MIFSVNMVLSVLIIVIVCLTVNKLKSNSKSKSNVNVITIVDKEIDQRTSVDETISLPEC